MQHPIIPPLPYLFPTLLTGALCAAICSDLTAQRYSAPVPAGAYSLATEASGSVLGVAPTAGGVMTTARWDGTNFANVATTGPMNRVLSAMAEEPLGGVVLFGGSPGVGLPQPPNVTWRWNGTGWSVLATATTPPARFGAAAERIIGGNTVMFGGIQPIPNGVRLADTWVFDGINWTQVAGTGPSARLGASMAPDGAGGVILFGGDDGTNFLNDTWRFDGTMWTQLFPATQPPVRRFAGMATDVQVALGVAPRTEVLIAGGEGLAGALSDIWSFQAGNWIQQAVSYAPIFGWANGAFDRVHREAVFVEALFGSGTLTGVRGMTPFGVSCLCPNGTGPTLTGSGVPAIGQTVNFNIVGAVANSFMFLAFDPVPQPAGLPIVPPFAPTCLQFAGTAAGFAGTVGIAITPAGTGTSPLAIPNNVVFVGTTLYYQGVDFGAICVTNGLELRVGR